MADPETLAALKRAYADTILNTTKEAAARVMFSEKKARRFQQELVNVREEAIHTLLRLKQMYDSKVKETEMLSSKQQEKVEELEAQLGEAEDIVGELRMELRVLRDELKRVKNGQTNLKDDHEDGLCLKNSDAAASVAPEVSCSHEKSGAVGSVLANGIKIIPSLTRINSINRCSYKDDEDRCHHTLPSILTKRKEAVDSSVANGVLSSSAEVGDANGGVCRDEIMSCKSVETFQVSGSADASDTTASVCNNVKDGVEPMVFSKSSHKDFKALLPLKTYPVEQENGRESATGETDASKGEKEISENMEVSASPLCEETAVSGVNKNRCIKYTFKRKRKKEVLSNVEGDSSFEESRNIKQKTEEEDNDYLESLKPSFTSESSRDSLCVAQVARQLVPFSEKNSFAAELVNQ
ncbi:unnamed protein product [Cochlearia groenlandica]